MNHRESEGVVTEDPLQNVQQGFQLGIRRIAFPPSAVFASSGDWTAFNGVVLKLLFGDPKSSRVMGSGVMVAPGVALAAKHVIEPELQAVMTEGVGFLAMAITPNGIEIWRVHQVVTQQGKDVALLNLRRASALNAETSVSQAILTTRVPRIGETIAISGFGLTRWNTPTVSSKVGFTAR